MQEKSELQQALEKLVKEHKALQDKLRSDRGKGNRHYKALQKEDIVKRVHVAIRETVYRKFKFAPAGKQLDRVMNMIWEIIREPMGLDKDPVNLNFEDFSQIYSSTASTDLSQCRQYTQSRCQQAALCEFWALIGLVLATLHLMWFF